MRRQARDAPSAQRQPSLSISRIGMAFTSIHRADSSALPLAPAFRAAEQRIAEFGVPTVILRNNAYLELYAGVVAQGARTGLIQAAAGSGRVAGATRHDLAEAAALAVLDDGLLGRTIELSGDVAYSHEDFATLAQRMSGRPVRYQEVTIEQRVADLRRSGMGAEMAQQLATIDNAIALGHLEPVSDEHTLSRLIGHPTMRMEELFTSR